MGTVQERRLTEEEEAPHMTPPIDTEEDSEDAESSIDIQLDDEPEKDETEQELERLVFGDSAGFRDGIRDFSLEGQEDSAGEDGATTGLEGLDDAQVGQITLALTTRTCSNESSFSSRTPAMVKRN